MHIKPSEGLTVRDPHTMAAIPVEGIDVDQYDMYWVARLRDGDVVLVDQVALPAAEVIFGAEAERPAPE